MVILPIPQTPAFRGFLFINNISSLRYPYPWVSQEALASEPSFPSSPVLEPIEQLIKKDLEKQ
ncbi:MAG TPA: hypothetical protein VKX33_02155 [Cyclobacteriaceae bacterium]|nr:hypothetical protein [Cyclobacteriaceae bacterium]